MWRGPLAPRFLAAEEAPESEAPQGLQAAGKRKAHGDSAPSPPQQQLPQALSLPQQQHQSEDWRAAPLVVRLDAHTAVLGFGGESCVRFVSGSYRLSLLQGVVCLNGYSLPVGKRGDNLYHSPVWLPASRLEILSDTAAASDATASKKKRKKPKATGGDAKSLSSLLAPITDKKPVVGGADVSIEAYSTLLLIEGVPLDEQEWLVAIEDQKSYQKSSDGDGGSVVRVESALLASPAGLASLRQEATTVSPDWQAGLDDLVRAARAARPIGPTAPADEEPPGATASTASTAPRALVCGARGVGKSTCLRLALNQLLNHVPRVCVIDCDVGQPELSMPGLVSLHVVDSPILSPPHLNLRQANLAWHFGDLSSKTDPDALLCSVQSLVGRYHELQAEHSQRFSQMVKERAAGAAASAPANFFDVLSRDSAGPTEAEAEAEAAFALAGTLPLLVNSDGFVRFMGAEVLSGIFSLVRPTLVLHIASDKDRYLPAVEAARCDAAVTVHTLQPARLTASKIAAADLRVLRLVAYFLRGSEYLGRAVRAGATEAGLSVRNGALTDKKGLAALALMSARTLAVPFQTVYLETMAAGVAPHLVLAAFNASLVALVASPQPPPHTRASLSLARSDTASAPRVDFSLLICTRGGGGGEAVGQEEPPAQCLGLGIVRAVDVPEGLLYLITPEDPASGFPSDHAKRLVRGSLSIPTLLLHAPTLPCHPYLSGESAGEGGGLMKARNNVKRRGQHQNRPERE